MLEHLICAVWPRHAELAEPLTRAVTHVCRHHGALLGDTWTTGGSAWSGRSWRARATGDGSLSRELREAGNSVGADLAVSQGALATHGPALVVSDVDSTFFVGEVIDDLAAHTGNEQIVADITARAMRGEIDFRQSLHERVATLRELDVAALTSVRDAVQLTPGARELSQRLAEESIPLGLVSGGFTEIVEPIAEELGIRLVRANHLARDGSRLTGDVTGDVVDAEEKVATAQRWADELDVELDRVVAVGDGANDLPMLQAVGLGVAFCAKPIVVTHAPSALSFPHLDAVLGLVGLNAQPAADDR